MSRTFAVRWSYLRYLRESRGIWGLVSEISLRLLRPLYHHQRQGIFLKEVRDPELGHGDEDGGDAQPVECLTLLSRSSLDAFREDISPDTWPGLERRFEKGRVAFLARAIEDGEDRGKIVGYSICEPGVFSALGRQGPVGSHLLFGHYVYVDEPYRGRRVFQLLRGAAEAYCRTRQIHMFCGVTSTRNLAALRARTRMGDRRVGTVSRVVVLGRFLVWETPWEEIEEILDG